MPGWPFGTGASACPPPTGSGSSNASREACPTGRSAASAWDSGSRVKSWPRTGAGSASWTGRAAARSSSSSCLSSEERRLRVLLVDDDRASVEALSLLLEAAGHRVVSAANGREALDHLHGPESFCVILLDV